MAGPAQIRLTRAGHAELTRRLAQYQADRIRITEEIQRAAADKDVRENAPLEAAREAQGMLMAKIQEVETTLRAAVVIDGEDGDGSNRVQLGSKVTLKEMTSERSTNYQLVDPDEASPLNGKISSASPVGAAILGRSPGQEVLVETPRGRQRYLIVKTS
jgi:transcription elongation factor GreA